MAELDRLKIAGRIQCARDEAGLTQPELGDALTPSVHYRTVQTWESLIDRTVPFDRLDEIAKITGTTKEWLLHGKISQQDESAILAAIQALSVRFDRLEAEIRELQAEMRAGREVEAA